MGNPASTLAHWEYWPLNMRVRLNYATIHHDPAQPTTTHHHPPPPTTIKNISTTTHCHPPPAKIYPPLPTTSQKMDHHPSKAKTYSYITSFRHCFNSFFSSKCNIPFLDGDFVWWSFDQFVLKIPNFYYSQCILRYLQFSKVYVSGV